MNVALIILLPESHYHTWTQRLTTVMVPVHPAKSPRDLTVIHSVFQIRCDSAGVQLPMLMRGRSSNNQDGSGSDYEGFYGWKKDTDDLAFIDRALLVSQLSQSFAISVFNGSGRRCSAPRPRSVCSEGIQYHPLIALIEPV